MTVPEGEEVECPHCSSLGLPVRALFSDRLFCPSCGRSIGRRQAPPFTPVSREPTDAEAFAKGCGFLLGAVFLLLLLFGGGLAGLLLAALALFFLDIYILLALAYRVATVALSYLPASSRPLPVRYVFASFPLPWYMLIPAVLLTGFTLLEVARPG